MRKRRIPRRLEGIVMVTAGEIFKITESISPSDIATKLRGPLPKTAEATFNFTQLKQQLFSTVVEKKRIASFFASKLSEMIFEKTSGVTEARIPPETFRGFHTKKPEDTEITFFDNVNIPNMDKLSLYGPDLVGATLFGEYTKLGDPWYIVARVSMHACMRRRRDWGRINHCVQFSRQKQISRIRNKRNPAVD